MGVNIFRTPYLHKRRLMLYSYRGRAVFGRVRRHWSRGGRNDPSCEWKTIRLKSLDGGSLDDPGSGAADRPTSSVDPSPATHAFRTELAATEPMCLTALCSARSRRRHFQNLFGVPTVSETALAPPPIHLSGLRGQV